MTEPPQPPPPRPPPPQPKNYWVARNGVEIGEFKPVDFMDGVASGKVRQDDWFWMEGMTDWKCVSEFKIPEKPHPPPRKPFTLAPPNLMTRKQYIIRWLIVFAILVVAFAFFVGAPTDLAQFAGSTFVILILLAFVYNIFWLSLPRLRSAKIPEIWVVALLVPFGVFALFVVLAVAEDKA